MSLAVIDISPLWNGDDTKSVARQICQACHSIGFFYATGHGVDERLIERVYRQAAAFHALPQVEKERYHIAFSRNHRGYVPPGEEDYGSEPGTGLKESFDLAADLPADDPDYLRGYRFLGPNVWPDIPGFKSVVGTYYEAMMALGRDLLRGFALALDLAPDYFNDRIKKPTSNLRLLHYPAIPTSNLGIGSHTDSECFTMLHQTKPGLQVMTVKDLWTDVPPVAGAFVVNVGDTLETWTNGRFRSGPHRVISIREERFSLPLFFAADFDSWIEPLPHFISDSHPPAYVSFRSGEHILSEYAKGFHYLRALHREGRIALVTEPDEASKFARMVQSD